MVGCIVVGAIVVIKGSCLGDLATMKVAASRTREVVVVISKVCWGLKKGAKKFVVFFILSRLLTPKNYFLKLKLKS